MSTGMKVLHFGTLYASAGGPAMSTYLSLKGLRALGTDALMAMFELPDLGALRGDDVPIVWCRKPWRGKLSYSPILKKELLAVEHPDIYHIQGVWQYPSYAMADVARRRKKPYLITPRGMLYPQDIQKSNALFKRISLKWRLLDDLNRAACVHVTCEEEMKHCRALGVKSPIAVIPNPVEVKTYLPMQTDDIFRVGYLGRLSPRKNVESLLTAFAQLNIPQSELLIIGGGDEAYEHYLRQETQRMGLTNVTFTGFLSGEEKDKTLSSLSLLVMPSEFENMGNVILEGLIRGIPCIATKGAPWKDLEDAHCGWWVNYNQEAITEAIRQASMMDSKDLAVMGANGKQLIKSKYAVEVVVKQLNSLYMWIMGRADKPSFVYL